MSRSIAQAVLDPTPTLDAARRAFNAFVDSLSRDARTVALHDSDADGVTAGVVWQCAFERAGFAQCSTSFAKSSYTKAKAITDTVTIKRLAEVCRSSAGTSCWENWDLPAKFLQ